MDFSQFTPPGVMTRDQEQTFLASCPEGSLNHELSKLPVNIAHIHKGMIIKLPATSHPMIVTVKDYRGSESFESIIVASQHPRNPVGGHNIVNSAAELKRGTLIDPHDLLTLTSGH